MGQLNITIMEFKELESNYASDVSRLAFIADGKKHLSMHKVNSRCPSCDGEVKIVRDDEQFIRSAKAELADTIAKQSELVEQINIATDELKELKAEIARILDTIEGNKKKYKKELLPLQNSYMNKIRKYQSYLTLQERTEALQSLDDSLDKNFIENGPYTADKVDYEPNELFIKSFAVIIADNCKVILRAMNITPLNKVEFDIIVNDNPKVNRSKSYSLIFNSAVVFALRKYINDYAFIKPGFYFIDFPLHGLFTEFDNEILKNNLRKGFFRYAFDDLSEENNTNREYRLARTAINRIK